MANVSKMFKYIIEICLFVCFLGLSNIALHLFISPQYSIWVEYVVYFHVFSYATVLKF